MYMLNSFRSGNHHAPWLLVPNVFTPDECEYITEMQDSVGVEMNTYNFGAEGIPFYMGRIDDHEANRWMFDRVGDVVMNVNDDAWQYDITHLAEGIQLHYNPEGHYMHPSRYVNNGYPFSLRKLVAIVHLTDPKWYEGGEIGVTEVEYDEDRLQGSMLIFPANQNLEHFMIKENSRHLLVIPFHGPHLR